MQIGQIVIHKRKENIKLLIMYVSFLHDYLMEILYFLLYSPLRKTTIHKIIFAPELMKKINWLVFFFLQTLKIRM